MTSSPGTRPRTGYLALALVAWLPASCAAPQPEECAAYLACFFPKESESPYADVPGVPCYEEGAGASGRVCQAELADRGAKAHALYGPAGECWRSGTSDPLYQTCKDACADALREECGLAADPEREREPFCVVGRDEERRFVPGDDESLAHSCVELDQETRAEP